MSIDELVDFSHAAGAEFCGHGVPPLACGRSLTTVHQSLGTLIDLSEYKGIVAPWNNWRAVQAQCASLAAALIEPPRV